MPVTTSEVVALLSVLALEVDDTIIDFLATALLESDCQEESREFCEPWLGDKTELVLEAMEALKPKSKPAGLVESKVANRLVGKSASKAADKVLEPGVAAVALAAVDASGACSSSILAKGGLEASSLLAEEGVGDIGDVPHGKVKGKAKVKAPARAKKKSGVAVQSEEKSGVAGTVDVMECTAQVSRFHKEAVENEITSALDVDIHGLCISVAGTELVSEAHLKLCPGQRYGLIGRNGSGKSTLMRAMEMRRIPGFPEQCTTLLVSQEDIGDDRNPVEVVLAAHEELQALLRQEALLQPGELDDPLAATRALRELEHAKVSEERQRLARHESKLSGQRGRDARKVLLEAERLERESEQAMEVAEADPLAPGRVAELLAHVREGLRILGPDALQAKAQMLLKGLGFKREQLEMPTARLSGGWRMRVAIARALLARPSVLMLDEPTNHLDWASALWLEGYLQSVDMEDIIVVLVSHDRTFLDAVCTLILRIHSKQLHLHDGNFSAFEQAHREDQEHRAELAQRANDKREKVEKQVQQMESKGRKSNNDNLLKAVASRRTKLGLDGKLTSFNRVGLERDGCRWKSSYGGNVGAQAAMLVEANEDDVKFTLKAAVPLGFDAALLQCREVVVGYTQAEPLVKKFDLDVRAKARIALLGVNGSGKTTLLRTLAKELAPLRGEVYNQPKVVVGFFNQHQADDLPYDQCALEVLMQRHPGIQESDVRAHLGNFGIGRLAVHPIGTLSGGEKCRVALAAVTMRPPHVLLLDEPTNHLDLATVQALCSALESFEGSVVVTSHDRHMLREVCTDFYVLRDRQLAKVRSLDDFVRSIKK